MTDEKLVAAATEAYIYGYPLCYNIAELGKFPAGEASAIGGVVVPWNEFGRARELLDASVKFVSPNNDTLYVLAPLDVASGPQVLHVPDTGSRYYVLQFVDAWTNNFAYIGRRASGTAEAEYLLVPPGYDADVPDGMTIIELPSTIAVIVGRIQIDGTGELPAVHALQDQFTLRPLDPSQPAPRACQHPIRGSLPTWRSGSTCGPTSPRSRHRLRTPTSSPCSTSSASPQRRRRSSPPMRSLPLRWSKAPSKARR